MVVLVAKYITTFLLFLLKEQDRLALRRTLLNLWSNLVYAEQACSWTGLSLGTCRVGNESTNSFTAEKNPGSGQIINNKEQAKKINSKPQISTEAVLASWTRHLTLNCLNCILSQVWVALDVSE